MLKRDQIRCLLVIILGFISSYPGYRPYYLAMKKFWIFIFLFSTLIVHGQTKHVLFIGNSYTFSNSMPQMVSSIASSMGDNVITDQSTISNYSLMQHSSEPATLALIRQGGWDFVVLQEYSQYPSELISFVQQNVYPYATYLDNQINTYNSGAETVFYMTWGRRDGDDARCPVLPQVCTYIGMDNLTRQRYMFMAQANHAIVSPVGAVWRYLRQNNPSIELYIADKSHPSVAGSYAAACSFYTAIYRKDPRAITYNSTLSQSDAAAIRNAAKLVVYDSLLTWHIGEYDLDRQAPTIPGGLAANNISDNSFTLTWTASTDNVGVTGYKVYQNGTLVNTVTGTSASITALNSGTTYAMTVSATDAAGNTSAASTALNVTTTFTPVVLTITGLSAVNKVYNGTTSAVLNTSGASLVGVLSGDAINLISSGSVGTFSNKNVGTSKTVTTSGFSLGGADAWKYTLIQPSVTANITPASLTVTGVTVNNKVYNGTTTAALNTGSAALSGKFGADLVNLVTTGASGIFSSKNAGSNKTVTISGFTISGTDSGNYTLVQPTATGSITTAGLSVTGVTANNKIYDGTTTAMLNTSGASLSGVFGGDAVTLNTSGATGTFASINIGTAIPVSTSGFSLGGIDAINYSLTQPSTTASINGIVVTVTGVTANDREYNGTTSATLNAGSATLSGVLGGDAVNLVTTGAIGTFDNKNIGTLKTVTTSGFTLNGADAAKYILTQPSETASIAQANLTITGVSANSKVYDGNTTATLNTASASLVGLYAGDAVNLVTSGATGVFASQNVGVAIVVSTSGFTLSGGDSPNYILTQPTLSANITSFGLTLTGVTAINKVYDGLTSASLNTSSALLVGILGSDDVSLINSGAVGTFSNKNVGTLKTVTTSGFTLGGVDAGKYTLVQPSTTANITPAVLTVSGVTVNNKVYNGTTSGTLNTGGASLSGKFGTDVVNLVTTGASGIFSSKNAGSNKTVTISGFAISGTDSGNYTLVQPTATGNITTAGLSVTGVIANNKIYDGTTTATLNTSGASLSGVFGGDAVTLNTTGATGTFASINIGTAIPVSTSGFSVGGIDAVNYSLNQPSTTANINGIALTVTGVTANSKVYNGTTTATLNTGSATLSGVLGGDAVNLVTTGANGIFVNKNAGTSKAVTTSGFTLNGADAAKYILTQPLTTANITQANLTVTGVTVNNKVYNGNTAATINTGSSSLNTVFGTDIVTLVSSGATAAFTNKNAGANKPVTISGLTLGGADSGNYILTQPTANADITVATLTVTVVSVSNKVYNGTTTATLNTSGASLSGVFGGDQVNLIATGASGYFANKNAGVAKPVTTTGFTLGGTDAANYTLLQPVLTGSITPLALSVTGLTVNNKTYNGTTTATLNTASASLSGVFSGDALTLITTGATGAFSNKNVGTGKTVSISGLTLGGSDSGNYNLTPLSSTANIAAAPLTVSGVTANNRVYNGTTSATINTGGGVLIGIQGTDAVNLNLSGATGSFVDKNVGNSKTVNISGAIIGGTDTGNYTLAQPTALANITGLLLTISGVSASNKIYNGLATATLNTSGAVLAGVLSGDAVSLISTTAVGTFVSKSVGSAKPVSTSGFTLGGADGGNYLLSQPALTANITSKPLTIGGSFSANNKVYDGTTSATITTNNLTLITKEGNDDVALVVLAVFSNRDVGTDKTVSLSGSTLAGTDALNYSLSLIGAPTTTATITLFGLTVTGITANNKVYDGTTSAYVNAGAAVLVGVHVPDVVQLVSSGVEGSFVDKNVGPGKTVRINGLTLSGADAWKYVLIQPTSSANLTSSVISVLNVVANDKAYDGTVTASLKTDNALLSGVFGADAVSLVKAGATGTFADKNEGIAKNVTISGFALSGTDAVNYSLVQPAATASITKGVLTITGVIAKNMVYNGTTATVLNTVNSVLKGIKGSDIVTLVSSGAKGTFSDKNVGKGKVITLTGFTITGPDASNYILAQPLLYADVTARTISINAKDQIKSYGTNFVFSATDFTSVGLVPGDNMTGIVLISQGAPSTANSGTYTIIPQGGTDQNYSYTYVNGSMAVRKSVLTVRADNKVRPYGSENPVLTVSYTGFKNNEDASVLEEAPGISTNALKTSSLGIYPISISGGSDNNYDLTLIAGTLEIQKAPLIITADNKIKAYREENPPLSVSYSGFVLDQNANNLDQVPSVSTDADNRSDAGDYDIIVSGAKSENYNIIYKNGIIIIKKADQYITFDDLPDGLRMTQELELKASSSSGLEVTFKVSDPSLGILNANLLTVEKDGKYTITARQEGDQNWNPAPEISKQVVTLPTFDNISSLFTPNNDGMNDYWYFPDLESFGIIQVTIYNRFGQVVYRSECYKNDWDGKWNGYALPEATYYYIINSSKKGFIKGVVNIIR
jgi:gliding motility-associated-like protein